MVALCAASSGAARLVNRLGSGGAALVLPLCAFKVLRQGFSDPSKLWMALLLADLLFTYDLAGFSEGVGASLALNTSSLFVSLPSLV
jgi:hypothetical protein